MKKFGIACLVAVLTCGTPLVGSHPAFAQASSEAASHFKRGVALFNEADYAGALVEFKKANELAPNPAVLFNIAQTQYQLRSYAAALTTFERFLAEAPSTAEHRTEAQSALETLKSRVGKIEVAAPEGSEIAIDDEVAGKAPLAPVVVSVGRRRITATKDGRTSPPKVVEVSAGETQRVELKVGDAPSASPSNTGSPNVSVTAPEEGKPEKSSMVLPIVLFVGAGAAVAGAVVTGILASGANGDLKDERAKFPADRSKVDDLSSKTKTLALVTDILGASAIVLGGVGLYFTLTRPKSTASLTPAMNLRLTGSSAALEGRF